MQFIKTGLYSRLFTSLTILGSPGFFLDTVCKCKMYWNACQIKILGFNCTFSSHEHVNLKRTNNQEHSFGHLFGFRHLEIINELCVFDICVQKSMSQAVSFCSGFDMSN